MFAFLKDYKSLEKQVMNVIVAEFFIQLVNATFINILPLYMDKEGFTKENIALYITFRYLGVFVLAIPLGYMIRGKKLEWYFKTAGILVPVFGLFIVYAIWFKLKWLMILSLLLWGASFTLMQIPVSPFILRNSSRLNQTAGISLSYSTWSLAGIVSGLMIWLLDILAPEIFNERMNLIVFSLLGLLGLPVLFRTKFSENVDIPQSHTKKHVTTRQDWTLIVKGLVPTLIIATGAGLTIPFISLFFGQVHNLQMGGFSFISSLAAILVAYGALMVPRIKQYIGYKIAIPTTQSLAVVSLIALATTQFYSQYSIALYIAIGCYLLRQPLMNMAGPMTTEVVLNYVGKNNREITSALTSAIWSGSWVISGFMVKIMFGQGYEFVNIFLITSAMYAFGVVLYYMLILDYIKREDQDQIDR
jgi:hypothetical protein